MTENAYFFSFSVQLKIKMAKIGIDIRNIGKQRTGDEVVFFNLVKNLAKIDGENEYFLFTDIIDAEVLKYVSAKLEIENKNNFKIISLKSSGKFSWNILALPDYLRKNPVDVYHTQYITPFFVSKKIKVVTHIHDVSFNAYPEHISRKDLFFLKKLIPKSLKRADKIVAISIFTKNEILKHYQVPEEKIVVVHNAVGDNFLEAKKDANLQEAVRKKYNLPDKFILYVGTLQPRKNIPMLLEAYANVRPRISGVDLVLVGNKKAHNFDPEIDSTLANYNLEKNVFFPGYIESSDLLVFYQIAELFVFPSLYEGFGIPILESMSQETPVLISEIPVHREIAGEAALYFNLKSVDDFSDKLYNSMVDENLRRRIKDLGLNRVSFFSWEKSARKMLSVYKELFCS